MNFDSLSFEELEVLSYKLQADADALKAQRLEVKAALDKKIAERMAEAKLSAMSEDEKDAIVRLATLKMGSKQNAAG